MTFVVERFGGSGAALRHAIHRSPTVGTMRPLSDVRALVLDRCPPLDPVAVDAGAARGLVLAGDVVAPADLPGFASSAMDGFAVRSADVAPASSSLPVVLEVIETVMAGQVPTRTVAARQAVRIMTGAPVPDGADAVVPVEVTRPSSGQRGDGETVAVLEPIPAGRHVRGAADDVTAGTVVARKGSVVNAAVVGVLVSSGLGSIEVVPRPRVGVFSTGNELVTPPRRPVRGQVRDSNRPMLLAAVAEAGAVPVDLGWVRDDVDAVASALRAAAFGCDLILTSGGVSMGEADVVKQVLDRLSEPEWIQVAIRPAKPFAVASVNGVPLLGLPGNPVSALVSFEVLARPAIRRLSGRTAVDRPRLTARAAVAMARNRDGKDHLVRVVVRRDPEGWTVAPVSAQGSHQLTATSAATGLAVVPDGDGIPLGGRVEVIVLDVEGVADQLPQ